MNNTLPLKLGDCYYKLEKCKEALKEYEKYENMFNTYNIKLKEGKCYDKMKKFKEAAICYGQALELY